MIRKSIDFIKMVQGLPEEKRRIIFWAALVLISSIVFLFWLRQTKNLLEGLNQEQFQEEIKFPEIEGIDEPLEGLEENWQELQKAQEMMEKLEKGDLSPEELEALEVEGLDIDMSED